MTSLEAVQPQYSTCSQNRLSNRVKLRSASKSVGQMIFDVFREIVKNKVPIN